MRHGARPVKPKYKDYDFLKTHKLGAITPVFQDEFFADAGLTMPDQEVMDTEFTPPTPPLPYGCTDFAQAELRTDLTRQVTNPNDLEAVTHANANGGYDIRESLDAAVKLGWFKGYFNIRAKGLLDFFDAFRIAQVQGVSVGEKRSITWGTPWFPSWERAAEAGIKVMPMPTNEELNAVAYGSADIPWHDSKLDGWTTQNGVLVYRDKSWQGTKIGFLFFPREVVNNVMQIYGTAGFTATLQEVQNPQRVDLDVIQWIVSFVSNLLKKYL